MKNIKLVACSFLLFFCGSLVSCENDGKTEYLDDYDTILYFLKSGVQKVDIYKTGENAIYPLNITKSGSNLSSSTRAEVLEAEKSVLDNYNEENFTEYIPLPKEYYSLGESSSIDISSSETYKNHSVELYTDKIDQLLEDDSSSQYVLALTLHSADSVNITKNLIIIEPIVKTPSVQFGDISNNKATIETNQTENVVFRIPVSLSVENKWDFTATVGVNNGLIDAYNESNNTEYKELSTDHYTLANNGILNFSSDKQIQELEITILADKVNDGKFILPLQVMNISNDNFEVSSDKGVLYYIVDVKLESIPLTVDMLSSNATEPTEGSLANLLDNNTDTYFHSAWSLDIPEAHYLLVALKEPVNKFSFEFIGRSSGGNASPAEIILEGSIDGSSFVKIGTIDSDKLPTGALGKYASAVYDSKGFKFIKLIVTKNKTGGDFFVFSEFRMFEAKR